MYIASIPLVKELEQTLEMNAFASAQKCPVYSDSRTKGVVTISTASLPIWHQALCYENQEDVDTDIRTMRSEMSSK